MSDISHPHPSLGVMGIIGEAFTIVFAHFIPLMAFSALPALPELAATIAQDNASSVATSLDTFGTGSEISFFSVNFSMSVLIAGGIIATVLWSVYLAATAKAVVDIKSGQPVDVLSALAVGLRNLCPVAVFMVLTGLAAVAWLPFLLVPGLYLVARWFVIVPVVAIDGAGWRALGRTASLTKGYRWPLVGLFLLNLVLILGIGIVTGILEELLKISLPFGGSIALAVATISAIFTYAFSATITALAFVRLRDIKESGGSSSLEAVFD